MNSNPNTGLTMSQRQRTVARELREYVSREDVLELCADVLANVLMLPGVELVPMDGGEHGSRVFYGGQPVCCVHCQNTSPRRTASIAVGDDSGVWIFSDCGDAVEHIAGLIKDNPDVG